MTIYNTLYTRYLLREILLNQAYTKGMLASELKLSVKQLNHLLTTNIPQRVGGSWELRLYRLVKQQQILVPINIQCSNLMLHEYKS